MSMEYKEKRARALRYLGDNGGSASFGELTDHVLTFSSPLHREPGRFHEKVMEPIMEREVGDITDETYYYGGYLERADFEGDETEYRMTPNGEEFYMDYLHTEFKGPKRGEIVG